MNTIHTASTLPYSSDISIYLSLPLPSNRLIGIAGKIIDGPEDDMAARKALFERAEVLPVLDYMTTHEIVDEVSAILHNTFTLQPDPDICQILLSSNFYRMTAAYPTDSRGKPVATPSVYIGSVIYITPDAPVERPFLITSRPVSDDEIRFYIGADTPQVHGLRTIARLLPNGSSYAEIYSDTASN